MTGVYPTVNSTSSKLELYPIGRFFRFIAHPRNNIKWPYYIYKHSSDSIYYRNHNTTNEFEIAINQAQSYKATLIELIKIKGGSQC